MWKHLYEKIQPMFLRFFFNLNDNMPLYVFHLNNFLNVVVIFSSNFYMG